MRYLSGNGSRRGGAPSFVDSGRIRTPSIPARVGVLLAMVFAAAAPSRASEPGSVSLTVYNQNFALVKDVRSLDLQRGSQQVRIDDVAAFIDPTSVHFAPPSLESWRVPSSIPTQRVFGSRGDSPMATASP